MHWALVAHRDQRDVNLSSLRMLVVADGSNPCKLTVFLICLKCLLYLLNIQLTFICTLIMFSDVRLVFLGVGSFTVSVQGQS